MGSHFLMRERHKKGIAAVPLLSDVLLPAAPPFTAGAAVAAAAGTAAAAVAAAAGTAAAAVGL